MSLVELLGLNTELLDHNKPLLWGQSLFPGARLPISLTAAPAAASPNLPHLLLAALPLPLPELTGTCSPTTEPAPRSFQRVYRILTSIPA